MNLLQNNSVLHETYQEDTTYWLSCLKKALSKLLASPKDIDARKELGDALHSLRGVSGLVQAWSVADVLQDWERLYEFLSTHSPENPDQGREILELMLDKLPIVEDLVKMEIDGAESKTEQISSELIDQLREIYPLYFEGIEKPGSSDVNSDGVAINRRNDSPRYDSALLTSAKEDQPIAFQEVSKEVISRILERVTKLKGDDPNFDQLSLVHDDFHELRALSVISEREALATLSENIGHLTMVADRVKDEEPDSLKKILQVLDQIEPLLTGFNNATKEEEGILLEAYQKLYDQLSIQWPGDFRKQELKIKPSPTKKKAAKTKKQKKKVRTDPPISSDPSNQKTPEKQQEDVSTDTPQTSSTGAGDQKTTDSKISDESSEVAEIFSRNEESSTAAHDFLDAVNEETTPEHSLNTSSDGKTSDGDGASSEIAKEESSTAADDFLNAVNESATPEHSLNTSSDEKTSDGDGASSDTALEFLDSVNQDEKQRLTHPKPSSGRAVDFLNFVQQEDPFKRLGTPPSSDESITTDSVAEIEADEQMLQYFYLEATEHLENIEMEALAWAKKPANSSTVLQHLFRLFHTLKGAAHSMGLTQIGDLSHTLEDLLEEIMEHKLTARANELSPLVLDTVDLVRKLIDEKRSDNASGQHLMELERIHEQLTAYRNVVPALVASSDQAADVLSTKLEPPPPLLQPAQSESPKEVTEKRESSVVRVTSQRLENLMNLMGEVVVSRSRLDTKILEILRLREELNLSRGRLVSLVYEFQDKHEYSSNSESRRALPPGRAPQVGISRSPVDLGQGTRESEDGFSELEFDRYDDYNILARNLVEIGADTSEIIAQLDRFFESLSDESTEFSKTTSQLQDEIIRIRMVPLTPLFQRLHRAALDAAQKEQKQIEFDAVGGDTVLDKSIMDQLYSPLLHVIRNAVSHGIEDAQTRKSQAKPDVGHVSIRAYQRAHQVVLEISDDGQGLDFESIRNQGVRRGILSSDQTPNQEQLTKLIFDIGFSTSDTVTDVSGRGIGMDVVRQEVEKLNGTIDIASTAKKGCTLTIRLPLSLSINEALIVKVAGHVFALPLHHIERVVKVSGQKVTRLDKEGDVVQIQEAWVPVRKLSQLLGMRESDTGGLFVIVRVAEQRWALQVSDILRKQDIVVRPLGQLLNDHPFFFGFTLFGDGSMVIILDLLAVILSSTDSPSLHTMETVEVEGATSDQTTKGKILIVDDSLSIRKIAESYVSELGYDVDLARDGLEALERLRTESYRLILTDLEMPRVHGFELIAEVRRNPITQSTPLLVASSRDSEKHRQKAKKLGANGFLVKPFSIDHLRHAFQELLVEQQPVSV